MAGLWAINIHFYCIALSSTLYNFSFALRNLSSGIFISFSVMGHEAIYFAFHVRCLLYKQRLVIYGISSSSLSIKIIVAHE